MREKTRTDAQTWSRTWVTGPNALSTKPAFLSTTVQRLSRVQIVQMTFEEDVSSIVASSDRLE